jgi:hypothetical protein
MALILAFVLLLPAIVYAAPTSTANPAEDTRQLVVPKLNIKIPGLVFATESPVVKCEGTLKCISIPFLAQYIAAFFKILLGIGLVATALMIIYGGFLYVLGSTGLQVSDAKKKIVDALVGLAILIGAYLILMNINPQSVTLKGIQIPSVSLSEQQFLEMTQNTTIATMGDTGFQTVPGEGECPMVATAQNQSNKIKYYNGILATVKGGTYVERLKKVANIVTNCNVNLLDCGHTAMAIMALAGIGETNCLLDEKKICWEYKESNKNLTVIYGPKNETYLNGLHKNGNCAGQSLLLMDSQRLPQNQAVAKAREKLEGWEKDYPNSVADMLQPGDYVWTYTANDECNGLHSSIFLDWVNKSQGKARMVEGDIKHNPRLTQRCFKKACGGYSPIIRIWRPKTDRLRSGN